MINICYFRIALATAGAVANSPLINQSLPFRIIHIYTPILIAYKTVNMTFVKNLKLRNITNTLTYLDRVKLHVYVFEDSF